MQEKIFLKGAKRGVLPFGHCIRGIYLLGGLPREHLPDNAEGAGDLGSALGLKRSPGEGDGSLFQYSCLETSMNGGAWHSPQGHKDSDTTEHTHAFAKYCLK